MGDVIFTSVPGQEEEPRRWWQCPRCKAYIDVMTKHKGDKEDGPDFFTFTELDLVECPHCHCYGGQFDSVEPPDNPFFDERLPKYKAEVLKNDYAWAAKWIRISSSMINECGLFPSTGLKQENQEPHWPRDLAAVILAASIVGMEKE
jgi:hypothetical protein